MDVVVGGRGAGKTHELIRRLVESQSVVLLVGRGSLDYARSLGMEKFGMRRQDVIARIQPHDVDPQRLRGYAEVLVDNAEEMLRLHLNRMGIMGRVGMISIEGERMTTQHESLLDAAIADGSIFSANHAQR